MKNVMMLVIFIIGVLSNPAACQEEIPSYYSQNDFLMTSPGVYREGLLGFVNPANLALLKYNETRFYWSTDGTDAGSFNNWGLFSGLKNLGFGILRQRMGNYKTTDYRISLGGGNEKLAVGFSYGWSKVNTDSLKHEKLFKSGIIVRPVKYVSLGLVGDFSIESSKRQGIAEIGIRPLGSSRLTVFADMAMQKSTRFKDVPWSAGAVIELIPGINFAGRLFENESFTAGLTIDFGKGHLASQVHFNENQKHAYNTYSIRSGGSRPSIFPKLFLKDKMYLKINLKGYIKYLNYRFFDRKTCRFLDILQKIKNASNDPRISVIAVNISSMRITPELTWEIRNELKNARNKGKRVIVFTDGISITGYHLASVADKIVLDPEGTVDLFGYTLGKTYFKGTLEKLGLGFDEWRYYKYKSAAEVLSRDSMSEADKEQYQDYVDDLYETARNEICESRNLTHTQFDYLVDEQVYFLSRMAIEHNIVDTLARWSDADKIIDQYAGENLINLKSENLLSDQINSGEWEPTPVIAVVYGLGICTMDSGIKARWLEKKFIELARDGSVKAVVFRVDSPGGEAMASDVVAEALKKCARKKPVIVSQGQVAGSGGYWISMYGDKIVAGPNTITGSIGVIGGWLYDKGFSDKLGLTSDHVKRGKHADLAYGVRLPILNITVPERNLTAEELVKTENIIREFYDIFVKKVADSRNMSVADVEKVAQGHFYSGLDGKDAGLIDEIGGLMLAIEMARTEAGIKTEQQVEIREIPEYKGLFKIESPAPLIKTITDDPVYEYIRLLNEHRGYPLHMLIPGTYPTDE